MGVPNSRASLLGLVSRNRQSNNPSHSIRTINLIIKRPNNHSNPIINTSINTNPHLIIHRPLISLTTHHPPPSVSFFDPSSPSSSSSNQHQQHHQPLADQPIDLSTPIHLNCPPSNGSTCTCSSSSTHPPPSSSSSSPSHPSRSHPSTTSTGTSRSTHSNASGQTSSTLLNHTADQEHFQDHPFYPRSTSSHLSPHNQFSPLNLYGHPPNPHPHQHLLPTKSLLLHKKNFFVFRNGASGIPKNGFHPKPTPSPGSGSGSSSGNSSSRSSSNPNTKLKSQLDGLDAMNSVQVGEDAYFLRSDSLGVADGVGGWSGKPGANPGLFSSKLMHHCSTELARYEDIDDVHFLSYNSIDPVEVLQHAFERSIHESKLEGLLGSTTALIAILRDDELRIANLGDCCCSVIRGNDYIFRSEEQQHSFNYPVQIGTNSKSTPARDAQRYNVKVQKDDIVILGSDGLADNLFDEDILEEVLKFTSIPKGVHPKAEVTGSRRPLSAQMISESLCLKARTVVEDQQAVASPFSQRANEEGIHYVGGKNDDISVLVAIVGDQCD